MLSSQLQNQDGMLCFSSQLQEKTKRSQSNEVCSDVMFNKLLIYIKPLSVVTVL